MATLNRLNPFLIEDVCGQIKEGHDADFIVLDKDLELVATLGWRKEMQLNRIFYLEELKSTLFILLLKIHVVKKRFLGFELQ